MRPASDSEDCRIKSREALPRTKNLAVFFGRSVNTRNTGKDPETAEFHQGRQVPKDSPVPTKVLQAAGDQRIFKVKKGNIAIPLIRELPG